MKKVIGLALAAIIAVSVNAVFAGDGCCAGGKAKAASDSKCDAMYSKLNLTPDQKTKMAALQEQSKRATSTSEARSIMTAGLEKILTPEQLAQCKATCEKDAPAGKCPFMGKTDKKS
ncbi:MAG: hypothetical protein WCS70_14955 [Verrucomicrobiota bacterium]